MEAHDDSAVRETRSQDIYAQLRIYVEIRKVHDHLAFKTEEKSRGGDGNSRWYVQAWHRPAIMGQLRYGMLK